MCELGNRRKYWEIGGNRMEIGWVVGHRGGTRGNIGSMGNRVETCVWAPLCDFWSFCAVCSLYSDCYFCRSFCLSFVLSLFLSLVLSFFLSSVLCVCLSVFPSLRPLSISPIYPTGGLLAAY